MSKSLVAGSGAFGGDGSTTIGAGGGGGGGISNRLCTVVPGSVISVTVGAGGAAVTAEGDLGIAGGTSSFGSFCSATGGRGGVMNGGAQGGAGAGGDFNASLGLGFPPVRNSVGTGNWGGPGGGGESAFAALDTSILTRPGMGGWALKDQIATWRRRLRVYYLLRMGHVGISTRGRRSRNDGR